MQEYPRITGSEFNQLPPIEKATLKMRDNLIKMVTQAELIKRNQSNEQASRINQQVWREKRAATAEAFMAARSDPEQRNPEQFRRLMATAEDILGKKGFAEWKEEVVTSEVVQHSLRSHGFAVEDIPAYAKARYSVDVGINLPQGSSEPAKYFSKIYSAIDPVRIVEIPDQQIVFPNVDAMYQLYLAPGNLDFEIHNLEALQGAEQKYLQQKYKHHQELMNRLRIWAATEQSTSADPRPIGLAITAIPDQNMVDWDSGEAMPGLEQMLVADFNDPYFWKEAAQHQSVPPAMVA